jgi:hypothetical protein
MTYHHLHFARHRFITKDHFHFYLFFSFQFFSNCLNYFSVLALISLQASKYFR